MAQYSNRSLAIFLIGFALFLYIAGIGNSSILTQGDESDYIRSSQEMFHSSDYLSPTFRGELRFTKPPLLYWMVAGSYNVLDVSFFSSRLPSVICAVLTVLFVFRMGLLLFNRDCAWLAALLTATCFGMVKFSKIVLMESPLVLSILLSLYYFTRFYKQEKGVYLIVSFAFLGTSALLKSPVYPLIVGAAMVVFLLSEGRLGRLFCPALIPAGLMALIIAVPWYWAMVSIHGPLFTDFYLNEHFDKFTPKPHFILRVWMGLLLYMLPWTIYLLYAVLAVLFRGLFRQWNFKLLLIILLLFLTAFMFPNQKGLYYAIPMLPYAGLITGGILGDPQYVPGRIWDILTALILLAAGLVFAASIGLLDTAVGYSLLASVLVIAAAFWLIAGRKSMAIILAGCSLVPLYSHIFPSLNFEIIPVKRTLAMSHAKQLYSYKISPLKFANALDRDVQEILETAKLNQAVGQGGLIIIAEEDYKALGQRYQDLTEVRLEWKRWQRRIPFKKFVDAVFDGKPEKLHQNVLLIARRNQDLEPMPLQ